MQKNGEIELMPARGICRFGFDFSTDIWPWLEPEDASVTLGHTVACRHHCHRLTVLCNTLLSVGLEM
jgi:hypothetical protein